MGSTFTLMAFDSPVRPFKGFQNHWSLFFKTCFFLSPQLIAAFAAKHGRTAAECKKLYFEGAFEI